MIRRLVTLATGGMVGAVLLDRWLAGLLRDRDGLPFREPIVTRVDVDLPIGEAWTRITDIERQVEWMTDMKSVRILTPGPVGVGTRAEATIRILGIGASDPVEVTELEPPHRYGIRHEGLIHGTGLIALDTLEGGRRTRIEWSETLVPPVLPNLGWLVMRPILHRVFQADLDRFKAIVEGSGSAAATRTGSPGDAETRSLEAAQHGSSGHAVRA